MTFNHVILPQVLKQSTHCIFTNRAKFSLSAVTSFLDKHLIWSTNRNTTSHDCKHSPRASRAQWVTGGPRVSPMLLTHIWILLRLRNMFWRQIITGLVFLQESSSGYIYIYIYIYIYVFSWKHLKVILRTIWSTIFTYLKYIGLNSAVHVRLLMSGVKNNGGSQVPFCGYIWSMDTEFQRC